MADEGETHWMVIIGTIMVGAIMMFTMFGGGADGPTKGKSSQKGRLQPLN